MPCHPCNERDIDYSHADPESVREGWAYIVCRRCGRRWTWSPRGWVVAERGG